MILPAREKRIGSYDERLEPLLGKAREGGVDVTFSACVHDVELQAQSLCRRPHIVRLILGIWVGWVYKIANHGDVRHQLPQQPQPFCC